jgi:hypothetical protein
VGTFDVKATARTVRRQLRVRTVPVVRRGGIGKHDVPSMDVEFVRKTLRGDFRDRVALPGLEVKRAGHRRTNLLEQEQDSVLRDQLL